jgi:hypothetical protein
MFVGKVGAYLNEAPFKWLLSRVGPWPYPQGQTLPYYENPKITAVKSFIVRAPVSYVHVGARTFRRLTISPIYILQ